MVRVGINLAGVHERALVVTVLWHAAHLGVSSHAENEQLQGKMPRSWLGSPDPGNRWKIPVKWHDTAMVFFTLET